MPKSPIRLFEVLEYLKLEDADGLVPGSVKYVGSVKGKDGDEHYWSYPISGRVAWVVLARDSLGDAARVPAAIRERTVPLELHRTQRPLPVPKRLWIGENHSADAIPKWVPRSRVHTWDLGYVAAFSYDFEKAARVFGATPSTDRDNGGAGPARFFFLELARSKLARLECEQRHPQRINLYLPEKNGVAYWDDYDQVMNPLGVPLEEAFRQGGVNWRHRKPTPEAVERTRDHQQRMWIPSDGNSDA
jgi:hypothetical protein